MKLAYLPRDSTLDSMKYLIVTLSLSLAVFASALAPSCLHAEPERLFAKNLDAAHFFSSPVLAKLLPDSSELQIVQISGASVYALDARGEVLWSYPLPNFSCSSTTTNNKSYSTPAVADLDGDGTAEVVAGYGGFGGTACGGGVIALKGATGELLWHFNLKSLARRLDFFAILHSVFSSPAVVDLDGDGKREVLFGSWDRHVYALTSKGKLLWQYVAADTVWSSPAIVDADSNGEYEVLIGTDISGNSKIQPPTRNGGNLYLLHATQAKKRLNFRESSAFKWMRSFNQVLYASPVVGELITSNAGPEAAIASGCYFPESSSLKTGRWLKVVSLKNGKVLRTLEIESCSSSQAAIADLNSDGLNELVFPASGASGNAGKLIAWTPNTNSILWQVTPTPGGRGVEQLGYHTSPTIADITGDGRLEVILNAGNGLSIFDGASGSALSCSDGSCADGLPEYDLGGMIYTTPAVGDLDGDGTLEVVAVSSGSGSRTNVKAWGNFSEGVEPGADAFKAPWPQVRRLASHTGCSGSFCPDEP
jgi:outer membrane protein assembly factor BamB